MKIVIDLVDFGGDDELARTFLTNMLQDQRDYGGNPELDLQSLHMGTSAVVLGMFTGHTQDGQACIEPIS